MARLSPAALVVPAIAVLAVVAWLASPQEGGVLDRAAAALEEAGTATIRTEVRQAGRGEGAVTTLHVDFDRELAVIDDPEPGVARRMVVPSGVYEQLDDGTWLLLVDGAPPLFGQDLPGQLRAIEATVEQRSDRRYHVRYQELGARADATLIVDEAGIPVRFESRYDVAGRFTVLAWEVLQTGAPVEASVPAAARPVGTAQRAALLEELG